MAATFKIPMSKLVLTLFLVAVAAVAGAVTWSFRSGLMWTGICLVAVAGPLAAFYWYMLYITPKRATITVADEGILLAAPPFASAVIPWASVVKVFPANLVTDENFKITKALKHMSFGGLQVRPGHRSRTAGRRSSSPTGLTCSASRPRTATTSSAPPTSPASSKRWKRPGREEGLPRPIFLSQACRRRIRAGDRERDGLPCFERRRDAAPVFQRTKPPFLGGFYYSLVLSGTFGPLPGSHVGSTGSFISRSEKSSISSSRPRFPLPCAGWS